MNLAENVLYNRKNDTTSLKFNGKMDIKEVHTASLSEMNLERFLNSVGDTVEHLPDLAGKMKYFPEDPHTFTLKVVIAEHESRLIDPAAVSDDKGVETSESVKSRFKCFDEYEICDFSVLSCGRKSSSS